MITYPKSGIKLWQKNCCGRICKWRRWYALDGSRLSLLSRSASCTPQLARSVILLCAITGKTMMLHVWSSVPVSPPQNKMQLSYLIPETFLWRRRYETAFCEKFKELHERTRECIKKQEPAAQGQTPESSHMRAYKIATVIQNGQCFTKWPRFYTILQNGQKWSYTTSLWSTWSSSLLSPIRAILCHFVREKARITWKPITFFLFDKTRNNCGTIDSSLEIVLRKKTL